MTLLPFYPYYKNGFGPAFFIWQWSTQNKNSSHEGFTAETSKILNQATFNLSWKLKCVKNAQWLFFIRLYLEQTLFIVVPGHSDSRIKCRIKCVVRFETQQTRYHIYNSTLIENRRKAKLKGSKEKENELLNAIPRMKS